MILFPVANYVVLALQNGGSLSPSFLAHPVHIPAVLLMIVAPVIGYGLIQVRRRAWWAFLIFTAALIAFNIFAAFQESSVYNTGAFFRIVVFAGLAIYFLQNDISAP